MSADRGIGTGASTVVEAAGRSIIAGSIGHGRSTRAVELAADDDVRGATPVGGPRHHAGSPPATRSTCIRGTSDRGRGRSRPERQRSAQVGGECHEANSQVTACLRSVVTSAPCGSVPSAGPWHHRELMLTGSSTAAPTAKALSSLRRRRSQGEASPTLHARHQARRTRSRARRPTARAARAIKGHRLPQPEQSPCAAHSATHSTSPNHVSHAQCYQFVLALSPSPP